MSDKECGPMVCDFPYPPDSHPTRKWRCPKCGTLYVRRYQGPVSKLYNALAPHLGRGSWNAPRGYWSLPYFSRARL